MDELGTARGSIDLDLGKLSASIAEAVDELEKIDAASKRTDAELKLLQETSAKNGGAFAAAAEKSKELTVQLDAAKEKVAVYEREMSTLREQLKASEEAQQKLADKIEDTKGAYAEASQNVLKMDKALQDSRDDLAGVVKAQEEYAKTVQAAKDDVKKQTEALKDAKAVQSGYAKDLKAAEKAQTGIAREIEKTKAAVDKLYNSDKKSVGGTKDKIGALKELKAKLKDLQEAQAAAAAEVDKARRTYEQAGDNVETLAAALSDSKAELERTSEIYGEHAEATKAAKEAVEAHAQALKDAKQTQKDYEREVAALEQTQQGLAREMAAGESKLEKFGTECIEAKADIAKLTRELKETSAWTNKFGDAAIAQGQKLKKFGDDVAKVGGILTGYVTGPLAAVGGGAVAVASKVEHAAAQVESVADTTVLSMSEIAAGTREISDETGAAWESIYAGVYDYISATQDTQGAVDAANVAVKASIAGFTDQKTAMDGLTSVYNAYNMTGSDAMKHLSDMLLMTQNLGKTTLGEMAGSLGDVTSIAARANIPIEELLGALAAVTVSGVETSSAIAGIRGVIASIIDPTEQAKEAAEALGMSFSWSAETLSDPNMGLQGMLGGLSDDLANIAPKYMAAVDAAAAANTALATNTDAVAANEQEVAALRARNDEIKESQRALAEAKQKDTAEYKAYNDEIRQNEKRIKELGAANKALKADQSELKAGAKEAMDTLDIVAAANGSELSVYAQLFGDVEALNTAMILSSESSREKWAAFTDEIAEADGATQKAYDVMVKGDAAQADIRKTQIINASVELGQKLLPVINKIADKVIPLLDKFGELSDEEQDQVVEIGLMAAAAGPLLTVLGKAVGTSGTLLTQGGKLLKGIGKIGKATAGAATAATAATTAAAGTTGAGGLVGALGAVGGTVAGIAAVGAAVAAVGLAAKAAYNHFKEADFEERFGAVSLSAEAAKEAADRLTEDPTVFEIYTDVNAATAEDINEAMNDTFAEIKRQTDEDYINAQIDLKARYEAGEMTDEEYAEAKAQLEADAYEHLGEIALNQVKVRVKQVQYLYGIDENDAEQYAAEMARKANELLAQYTSGEIDATGLFGQGGFVGKLQSILYEGSESLSRMEKDEINDYLAANAGQITALEQQVERARLSGETVDEEVEAAVAQYRLLEAMSGYNDQAAADILADYIAGSDRAREMYAAVIGAGKQTDVTLLSGLKEWSALRTDVIDPINDALAAWNSGGQMDATGLQEYFARLGTDIAEPFAEQLAEQTPAMQKAAAVAIASIKSGTEADEETVKQIFTGFGVDLPDSIAAGIADNSAAAQGALIDVMAALPEATEEQAATTAAYMQQQGITDADAYVNGVRSWLDAQNLKLRVKIDIDEEDNRPWYKRVWDRITGSDEPTTPAYYRAAPVAAQPAAAAPTQTRAAMFTPAEYAAHTVTEDVTATLAATAVPAMAAAPQAQPSPADVADYIAAAIAARTPAAEAPQVTVQVTDGDVLLDGEKVGRKTAPVVSRIIAQQSRY